MDSSNSLYLLYYKGRKERGKKEDSDEHGCFFIILSVPSAFSRFADDSVEYANGRKID